MKKLIILLCVVCFSGCNFGEINIIGHKPPIDKKLPDFTINIDNHIITNDSTVIFLHIRNLGGLNFSDSTAVVIIYLDDKEKDIFNLNNLKSNFNFFIRRVIYTRIICKSMFATIDRPILEDRTILIEGFIKESNENNNVSNIRECVVFSQNL